MVPQGGGAASSRPLHVLAVDERPEVLELVEHSLGGVYLCELASSAAEARGKLTRGNFDIVLCDAEMAGKSGIGLIEKLARDHPETAVVVLTGIDDPRDAEEATRLGAHGYLVKPLQPGQLRFAVANALRQRQLEIAARATAHCLASAIELREAGSSRHIERMALITSLLGAELGLDPSRVGLLRAAAPMHDVGKIATPGGVLYKREALTISERQWMEAHTTIGHDILATSDCEQLQMAAMIALTHHEWFNGSGYPQGLRGDEIPVEGRIAAAADVLDALLSERPYRAAFSLAEATQLIAGKRGTHLDPEVVDALLANLDEVVALRG